MATRLVIPTFILLLVATVGADSPILVRLRGNFGTAPATVIVSARVERHAENRTIEACVIGEYSTCSGRPHVGLEAPLQVVFEPFRGLPQGDYEAVVTVVRHSRKGKVTRHPGTLSFRILPPFGG